MTSLIETLKEQCSFGFTGRVNLLLQTNAQFQGVIFLQDGCVVGAEFLESKGKKALFKMIFDDVEGKTQLRFVVEPEIVSSEHCLLNISFQHLKKEAQIIYQKYQESKKLKPAANLKLVINPEIIVSNDEITPEEFSVLSLLTEWCKVSDVYKYSQLLEFEITSALVSLRKKRAIKVFQN